MRNKDIIQPLVGTKNIVVKDICFDTEANALVISARPAKKERCRCSRCHRRAKYYDAGRGTRRWRALDMGVGKVYVEAPAPRGIYLSKEPPFVAFQRMEPDEIYTSGSFHFINWGDCRICNDPTPDPWSKAHAHF